MTQIPVSSEPLYSALGGEPDLAEIIDLFVEEMPDRIAALLEQLDTSNWEALRRSAHQLKGAAGSYGFEAISPFAAQLENSLRENRPEGEIREAVEALVAICGRARGGPPV